MSKDPLDLSTEAARANALYDALRRIAAALEEGNELHRKHDEALKQRESVAEHRLELALDAQEKLIEDLERGIEIRVPALPSKKVQ